MKLFILAFGAVILQAWASRKDSPDWYLGCIVPLLYGAAVAWMFVGRDCIRVFQIVIFGAVLPISLLLSVWWRGQREPGEETEDVPSQEN